MCAGFAGHEVAYRDEREEVQDKDQENLATRKPEFCFAVCLDCQNIAGCVQDNYCGADCGSGNVVSPIFQNNVERSNLKWNE